jgi:transcriptional regulator with XRE-family HTH domain
MAPWELGDRIRSLREAQGLSRAQLARRTGLSQIYVRKLEAGDKTSPTLPVLTKIARALGASVRVEFVRRPARRKARA